MMKTQMILLMSGVLLLSGCGGGDGKSNNASLNSSGNGSSGSTDVDVNQFTTDQKNTVLVNKITGIVSREALYSGLVNSLLTGANAAIDGSRCSAGTYQRSGNLISFDKCVGLFEIDDKAVVSGTLDVSNGYAFQNLTETFPSGNIQKINGTLQSTGTGSNDTTGMFSSPSLTVSSHELNAENQFTDVTYTFSDYKLVWTDQDTTHVKLQFSGKLKSTGASVGDFDVSFTNVDSPFFVKTNDSGLDGYPYSGILTINEQNPQSIGITVAAQTTTDARYMVIVGTNILFDSSRKWSDILNF